MKVSELRTHIIKPTLEELGLYTQAAENLLLGTCAAESDMGKYVQQIGGPALGIYQMEPSTYWDHFATYLTYHPDMQRQILAPYSCCPAPQALAWDLRLATIMARIQYYRHSEPLPDANDVEGMARYWKKYYNTSEGNGTVAYFIKNYRHYNLDTL